MLNIVYKRISTNSNNCNTNDNTNDSSKTSNRNSNRHSKHDDIDNDNKHVIATITETMK